MQFSSKLVERISHSEVTVESLLQRVVNLTCIDAEVKLYEA